MRQRKKVFTKQTVDGKTGELIMEETFHTQSDAAEQFARIFFRDMGILAKCSGAEKGTVLSCLQFLDYNTNEFILTPNRRDAICLNADIKSQTLTAALTSLRKKNILIKNRGYSYTLNPNILFYGEEKERKKMISNVAEYQLVGGKQKVHRIHKTK